MSTIGEHPLRSGARLLTSEAQTRVTDAAKAIVTFTASTDDEDRYGSVVVPGGLITDTFERSGGPILAFHDYSSPPIGKTLRLEKSAKALLLTVQFAVSQSERAAEIYRLVRDGFLTGLSIGFLPLKTERYAAKTVPGSRAENIRYVSAELLEASVVAVPANRYSLARAMAGLSPGTAASLRSFIGSAVAIAPPTTTSTPYLLARQAGLSPAAALRVEELVGRKRSR